MVPFVRWFVAVIAISVGSCSSTPPDRSEPRTAATGSAAKPPSAAAPVDAGDPAVDEYLAAAKKCAEGDGMACAEQASDLGLGHGVAKDPQQALVFDLKACELKNKWGCTNAGRALTEGLGIPKDEARGYPLIERACSMEHAYSCTILGRRALLKRDKTKARQLFAKACDLKDQPGCLELNKLDDR